MIGWDNEIALRLRGTTLLRRTLIFDARAAQRHGDHRCCSVTRGSPNDDLPREVISLVGAGKSTSIRIELGM